jgi:hypothetical protein
MEPNEPLETTPLPDITREHWKVLQNYFEHVDSILDELRPLADHAARDKTLVIMFSNFGQSELLLYFCCSAQARNLDLSGVLVFATDTKTKELVEGLGMTAFYNEAIFGSLPSHAAEAFGDRDFERMMNAKVMCIQIASMLGYDILFQDADVVWYRDPVAFFRDKKRSYFDVFIADDGNSARQLYVFVCFVDS